MKPRSHLLASHWWKAGLGLLLLVGCNTLPVNTATAPTGSLPNLNQRFDISASENTKFRLPPEYHPTGAVLISDKLMQDVSGATIVQKLLQSQSDVWLLSDTPELAQQAEEAANGQTGPGHRLYTLPLSTNTLWARDYGPLSTLPTTHYQGPSVDFKMLNSLYYPDRPQDNRVPQVLTYLLNAIPAPQELLQIQPARLPLALEGGNVLCNTQACFMSEKVLQVNQGRPMSNGQYIQSAADIQAIFASEIEQPVYVVPAMPYEGTGHIDMWAKFLDDQTVIIHQLTEDTIATGSPELDSFYRNIQFFLEEQATGKRADGSVAENSFYIQARQHVPNLRVVRLPMPLPDYQPDYPIVRSYTNSLLVNQQVLIPRYEKHHFMGSYPDQALLSNYEQLTQQAYQEAGYQPIWINSDSLIMGGGAIHCVTMQIPAPETP